MLTLFAMGHGGGEGWGARGLGPRARGRFFCLLWEHQGSRESEIFREFLKFKVFGQKKFFFKILFLRGSGSFAGTFSET